MSITRVFTTRAARQGLYDSSDGHDNAQYGKVLLLVTVSREALLYISREPSSERGPCVGRNSVITLIPTLRHFDCLQGYSI